MRVEETRETPGNTSSHLAPKLGHTSLGGETIYYWELIRAGLPVVC